MFSFSEPLICKLMDTNPIRLVRFNTGQLARIYPAGSRVDSSNYNPIPAWCMGAQLVALNHQTHDLEWQLNFGKFHLGKTVVFSLILFYCYVFSFVFVHHFFPTGNKNSKIV